MESNDRQREFVKLYAGCQNSVRQLLRVIVSDSRHLEDLNQAVALRLWEVFESYDGQRPFNSWARGVAAVVALEFRRSERRAGACLDPMAIAAIVKGFDRNPIAQGNPSEQLDALERCLGRLPLDSRNLIIKRYHEDLSVAEVAQQSQRSLEATYKRLHRTIKALADCIQNQIQNQVVEQPVPVGSTFS